MKWSFEYGYARIQDLQVSESVRSSTGKLQIKAMEIDGRRVTPTSRFWKSLFARFFISDSVFRYFEPEEVFQRIAERAKDTELRYCLELGGKSPQLLAVTNSNRPDHPAQRGLRPGQPAWGPGLGVRGRDRDQDPYAPGR